MVRENFGEVETARKLAEKLLKLAETEPVQYELTGPHNFLADKPLADWQ